MIPFFSLVGGILAGISGFTAITGTVIIIVGCLFYFLLNQLSKNPLNSYRWRNYHIIWIILWFTGIGIISYDFIRPEIIPVKDSYKYKTLSGEVISNSTLTSGDRTIVMVNDLADSKGEVIHPQNMKVLLYGKTTILKTGDIISCKINLEPIHDNENMFGKGYAAGKQKEGIYYSARLEEGDIIIHGRHESINSISSDIREKFIEFIEKSPLQRDTRNFLIVTLTGDTSYISKETRNIFADAGIAHILALSGMHISIIAGFLLIILFPINFTGRYKLRYFFSVILIWCYILITGMSPSTVRAGIMASVYLVALIIERKNKALNSLFIAGLIILLFDPAAIFDIGFQLSFITVAGIILFVGPLNPVRKREHPYLHNIINIVLVTIIAGLVSWVLCAFYFGRVSIMFMPLNIILVPLLPILLCVAIIYFITLALGINISPLSYLLDKGYELLYNATKLIGTDPDYVIGLNIEPVTVLLWLTGLTCFAIYINGRRDLIIASLGIFFLSGSIAFCILNPTLNKTNLIVCNTRHNVEFRIREGNAERLIRANSMNTSFLRLGKTSFLTLKEYLPDASEINIKTDYIIVTSSFPGNIEDLKELADNAVIILHPSIRKDREEKLIKEAEKYKFKIHSLRKDGAIHLE